MAKKKAAELNYAGGGRRLVAYLIDALIIGSPGFIFLFATGGFGSMSVTGFYIHQLVLIAINILYFALQESSRYQATIGKRVMSLQVTDKSGNRIGLARSSYRYILSIAPTIPTLCVNLIFAESAIKNANSFYGHGETISTFSSYMLAIMAVSLAQNFLMLCWFIPVLATKQKTGVHDLISKTRVLKIEK